MSAVLTLPLLSCRLSMVAIVMLVSSVHVPFGALPIRPNPVSFALVHEGVKVPLDGPYSKGAP